jgi:hypothetical protein
LEARVWTAWERDRSSSVPGSLSAAGIFRSVGSGSFSRLPEICDEFGEVVPRYLCVRFSSDEPANAYGNSSTIRSFLSKVIMMFTGFSVMAFVKLARHAYSLSPFACVVEVSFELESLVVLGLLGACL